MEGSKTIQDKEILYVGSAVLLMMLFGYTAITKLLEHDKFVFQMRLSPAPIMASTAPILAWAVPLIELLIVISLCFDRWRDAGLYASFGLLFLFEVYITAMLLSGSKLPCTCGGIVSKMSWTHHLWFNAVFMMVAVVPIIYNHSRSSHYLQNICRVRKRE